MSNDRQKVPEQLRNLAKLYEERGAIYGDNYKHAGRRLLEFFPEGLTLKTADDFQWFHLFVHADGKLSRYAQSRMRQKRGHRDSLDDLSVYSQMLAETDEDAKSAVSTAMKPAPRFGPRDGEQARYVYGIWYVPHEDHHDGNTVWTMRDGKPYFDMVREEVLAQRRKWI
jgi:hypothetical protein